MYTYKIYKEYKGKTLWLSYWDWINLHIGACIYVYIHKITHICTYIAKNKKSSPLIWRIYLINMGLLQLRKRNWENNAVIFYFIKTFKVFLFMLIILFFNKNILYNFLIFFFLLTFHMHTPLSSKIQDSYFLNYCYVPKYINTSFQYT